MAETQTQLYYKKLAKIEETKQTENIRTKHFKSKLYIKPGEGKLYNKLHMLVKIEQKEFKKSKLPKKKYNDVKFYFLGRIIFSLAPLQSEQN